LIFAIAFGARKIKLNLITPQGTSEKEREKKRGKKTERKRSYKKNK
jgi:hypothetical protein